MTEKGTPSETPHCSQCHPAEDCWNDKNEPCNGTPPFNLRYYERTLARFRDELARFQGFFREELKRAGAAETACKRLKKERDEDAAATEAERIALRTRAESPDHTCHWHDHFVAEAVKCLQSDAKCLAAERELEKKTAALNNYRARLADPLWLARFFHETYERLAPNFGYVTRPETRKFDPNSVNARLMMAVCDELSAVLQPEDKHE